MLAALLALFAAVATTFVYLLLTEEMDYASVRRRQLDAWAAVAAIACLAVILYGNASGRRSVERPLDIVPPSGPLFDEAIPRRTAAVTAAPTTAPAQLSPEAAVLVSEADTPAVEDSLPAADTDRGDGEGGIANAPAVQPIPVATDSKETVAPPRFAQTEPTEGRGPTVPPVTPTLRAPQPPTHVLPIFVSPTPIPSATATRRATAVSPPLATVTPDCGDPDDISVNVGDLASSVERVGGDVTVHFKFDVKNDSGFPVTLGSMRVSAVVEGSGSDTFGSTALSPVTIQPGAVYPVEDAVRIERYPAPNERVQLCLTFVPETCGRSRPGNRMGGRCWSDLAGF
jgi:hypothetical protein